MDRNICFRRGRKFYREILAFSDFEKLFLFSDLAVKVAKTENEIGFSMSEKARVVLY